MGGCRCTLTYSRVINIKICLLRKWRCGSNSELKLWTRFDLAHFFLVRAASLFMLRTFGAQINWRVISRYVLFDPHRFLSNKSPIHFRNMFLNGKRSKWKWTSIATVPDLCPTTVKILTHLISRYHLPLRGCNSIHSSQQAEDENGGSFTPTMPH